MTLDVPNTGMAVTVDIGNPTDIHPDRKDEVGRRLALWARAKVYGEDRLVHSGPLYSHMRIEGDRIRLYFDHVGGGLRADGGELEGFQIAGASRAFVPGAAEIEGGTVVVHNPDVRRPVAVRYAWAGDPPNNLRNAEGLPASPFRTDAWPGLTYENR
jgi:sialate O-acetylesterase